jgi:hypothetical protein
MQARTVLLTIGYALLVGCGVSHRDIIAYQGSSQPTSRLAVVKPQMFIEIESIDGDQSKSVVVMGTTGGVDANILLLPGRHQFVLRYRDMTKRSYESVKADFVILAGHRYLLWGQLAYEHSGVYLWTPNLDDMTNTPERWCLLSPRCHSPH